jgi:CRP-like cAMP-binding protein
MVVVHPNHFVTHANHLLALLPSGDFALLRPYLKEIKLVHEAILFGTGDSIDRVYFPQSGVISLVVELEGGEMIEAAMIGRDSIVGGSSALDGKIALNKAIVQVPGVASVLDVLRLRQVADQSVTFRTTLIRHEQVLLAQALQSVACNAAHSLESRLARWLLRTRDLTGSDTLPLTQEFLAQMLGVRRTSVSLVANALQKAGLIHYERGRIEIANLIGLGEASCECYETVKGHYDRLVTVHS